MSCGPSGGKSTRSKTEVLLDTPPFLRFRVLRTGLFLGPRFSMVEGSMRVVLRQQDRRIYLFRGVHDGVSSLKVLRIRPR